MQISCECLNVLVSSKNVEFMNLESYVTDLFTDDPLFKEDVGVLSLCSVSTQVPSLALERESGKWKIVHCINCDKTCYGTCQTLGFASVLTRKDFVVDTNKINRLKQNDCFSPIFKILIYRRDFSSDDESGDQKTPLYPAAASWLDEQTALTEERVKVFSEKEYAALDEMRKRAYKEQRVIKRREIECAKEIKSKPADDLSRKLKKTSLRESRQRRFGNTSSLEETMDAEGVFLLDGFEQGDEDESHPEDTDSSDSDDTPELRPRRGVGAISGAAQIAKSLPIPVPQFMEEKSTREGSFDQVPEDIAASIKELARSVHGDAIFGELPRPRFSNNL